MAMLLFVGCDLPQDDYELDKDSIVGDGTTIILDCADSAHTFVDYDLLGVTVIEQSKQSVLEVDIDQNYFTNACYVKVGSYFSPFGVEMFYAYPEGEISIIAYYPYQSDLDGSKIDIKLPSDQRSGFSSSKLYYGVTTDCTVSNYAADVTLESQLSTLVVNLVADGSSVTAIENYTVNLLNVATDGVFDLNNGELENSTTTTAKCYGYGSDSDTFKFLALPQTIAADEVFLEFVVNGEATRYSVSEDVVLVKGKTTTLTAVVNSEFMEITVSNPSDGDIEDWESDDDIVTNK